MKTRQLFGKMLDNNIDVMFAELNSHYIESQNAQINNNNVIQIEEVAWRQRCIDAAEAELTLYKMEPAIPLRDNGSEKYNCPLNWWKLHEFKYKMLSILAARYLCIPATSAPSERVFSAAGWTIAKDRSRLSPEHANELIFLHNAEPAIERNCKMQLPPGS